MINDNDFCWVCQKPAQASFCMRCGHEPGPFRLTPSVYYCLSPFCLSELIDWLEAVRKDLMHYRKQVKEKSKESAPNG
jgi:hypothetical protein